MASKYIQKFPIPEGFPEIVHDLAKEILRNQPADILEFSALYFKCLQEGTVLDYANRGQNIPCDFKTGVPKINERPQRKKPLNERDEALHIAAVENSIHISKKPMTPDQKLMQADSGNLRAKNNDSNSDTNSKKGINTATQLINDLQGNLIEHKEDRKLTENSTDNNKEKKEENLNMEAVEARDVANSAKGSRKSENRPASKAGSNTKEVEISPEKIVENEIDKQQEEVNAPIEENSNKNIEENPEPVNAEPQIEKQEAIDNNKENNEKVEIIHEPEVQAENPPADQ